MFKKLLFSIIPALLFCFSQVSFGDGIVLNVPKGNYDDVNVTNTQIEGNPDKVLATISFVNQYLWWAIGFLCFIFLIYNGVKLIMARGEKDAMSKAIKGLLGSVIGIVICFLSYSFVRVIVNLF
jgi:hypothetical protein